MDIDVLASSLAGFLSALQPYVNVMLGLVIGAGILSRGLELIRWGGRS